MTIDDLTFTHLRDENGSRVIRAAEKCPHRPDRGPLHADITLGLSMVESLDPVRFAAPYANLVEGMVVRGFDEFIAAEVASAALA